MAEPWGHSRLLTLALSCERKISSYLDFTVPSLWVCLTPTSKSV